RKYAMQLVRFMLVVIVEGEYIVLAVRTAIILHEFRTIMMNLLKHQDFLTATDMVNQVLEVTSYEAVLKDEQSLEAQSRLENISEFLTVTQDFEKTAEED